MEQIFLILAPKGFDGAERTTPWSAPKIWGKPTAPSRDGRKMPVWEQGRLSCQIWSRSRNQDSSPPVWFWGFFATLHCCPTLVPAPGGSKKSRVFPGFCPSLQVPGSPAAQRDQPLFHAAFGFPNLSQNPHLSPWHTVGPGQHPQRPPLLHLSPSPLQNSSFPSFIPCIPRWAEPKPTPQGRARGASGPIPASGCSGKSLPGAIPSRAGECQRSGPSFHAGIC